MRGLADEQWLELSMAGTSSPADRPFDAPSGTVWHCDGWGPDLWLPFIRGLPVLTPAFRSTPTVPQYVCGGGGGGPWCIPVPGGHGASPTMRTHLCPLPVLQKGAYRRRTCPVLFDVPMDEDSDTRNPRCARLSCNRVCVGGGCYGESWSSPAPLTAGVPMAGPHTSHGPHGCGRGPWGRFGR